MFLVSDEVFVTTKDDVAFFASEMIFLVINNILKSKTFCKNEELFSFFQ